MTNLETLRVIARRHEVHVDEDHLGLRETAQALAHYNLRSFSRPELEAVAQAVGVRVTASMTENEIIDLVRHSVGYEE